MVSWYAIDYNEENLFQGEILFNCSVIEPKFTKAAVEKRETELDLEEVKNDFIILTQSCDLEHDKIYLVVVAPVYSVGRYVAEHPYLYRKAQECAQSNNLSPPDYETQGEEIFLELAHKCNSISKEIDKIRKGERPDCHLLNEEPSANLPYCVVSFRNIYSVPKDYLLEVAKSQQPRIRLQPPYREHLSQAFARYFMRVGLPADISAFT